MITATQPGLDTRIAFSPRGAAHGPRLRVRRAMVDDKNAEAIRRLSRRVDEQDTVSTDRIDALAARIVARLDQIEARADRRAEITDAQATREFSEVRRDLGELRDVGTKLGKRVETLEQGTLHAAAQGAAEGAGRAATVAAKETAIEVAKSTARGFWATTHGKIVSACAVVAGIGTAIDNLPKVIHWLGDALKFMGTTK